MVTGKRREFKPNWTVAPGETLLEVLQERGVPQILLAELTGYSPKHVNQVIKGVKRISPEFAIALERELGIKAQLWGAMQYHYEAELARLGQPNPFIPKKRRS